MEVEIFNNGSCVMWEPFVEKTLKIIYNEVYFLSDHLYETKFKTIVIYGL